MSDSSSADDLNSFSLEHRARRLRGRNPPAKPAPPKHRFRRDLVLLGFVIAAAILLAPFGDVPNPDYPEARAQADGLNAAYRSVRSGDATLETAADAYGLHVHEFPVGERMTSMLTHPQATAGGTCYGLRTGGGLATAAVKFAQKDGCIPSQGTAFQAIGLWEDVLPSERMTTVWFIPALVILASFAIVLSTGIILRLITGR